MNTIEKLKEKSLQLKEKSLFCEGATQTEIEKFEEIMNIKLPQILKDFYLTNNGGCFAGDSWDKEELTNPDELGSIIWNSNYFLSLDQIIEAYNYDGKFTSTDFQEQEEDTQRRFIPIMHTSGQESIVWEATNEGETPILDAFHEYNADEWGVLYKSFEDLLNDYIEKEGQIETIA